MKNLKIKTFVGIGPNLTRTHKLITPIVHGKDPANLARSAFLKWPVSHLM
jgi:hypothetical protein